LNRASRGLVLPIVLIVGLMAPIATSVATAASPAHHTVKHKHVKKTKKKKAKTKKKSQKTAAAAPAASVCTPTSSALGSATNAFLAHIRSAHLEKSLGDQVKDASHLDSYAKLHTIWIEGMVDPLTGALTGPTFDAFMAHIQHAHLEKSPVEQAKDLAHADAYIKLHTVWLESMIDPFTQGSGTCSSTQPATAAPGAPPVTKSVMIADYKYAPVAVSVPVGSTVTWMNMDADAHTVTSAGGGPLSSSNLGTDATYSHTFLATGTFEYFCAIHPQMKGSVTVS
jgi:plastocyanin